MADLAGSVQGTGKRNVLHHWHLVVFSFLPDTCRYVAGAFGYYARG